MSEMILNHVDSKRIVNGVKYTKIDRPNVSRSPFIEKNYDFEDGFYEGEFTFESPLDQSDTVGTPESYARHRGAAALQGWIRDGHHEGITVLDLGSGTLDVARTIPAIITAKMNLVNSDISGPWSMGPNSAMERGVEKLKQKGLLDNFKSIENVEYDFNVSEWPFNDAEFDYVISNLALCHIAYERKTKVLSGIYSSLKTDGKLIIGDVFQKDEAGSRFTEAGQRGPEECWGYLSVLTDFLAISKEVGFKMDETALRNFSENRNHQTEQELERAKNDIHATMAINKAVWGLELTK